MLKAIYNLAMTKTRVFFAESNFSFVFWDVKATLDKQVKKDVDMLKKMWIYYQSPQQLSIILKVQVDVMLMKRINIGPWMTIIDMQAFRGNRKHSQLIIIQ